MVIEMDTPSARATVRYLPVSPYKIRQVLDLVRGLPVDDAIRVLQLCEKDAADSVLKLLDSAVANAEHDNAYITAIVAVMGTTISPYLFFWQSSEEVEDERVDPEAHSLVAAPREAPRELARIRFDTYIGMGISNLIALFIIITAAATLNAAGITDVQSSTQAAEALRPLAGPFAFALFALGIIGTGLLAIPVLAGSAAYAVGEARRWPTGLARRPLEAKAFYGTIAIATMLGVAMNFGSIDPIKALFWSAVINGVVAVPLMVVLMIMARRTRIMGRFAIGTGLTALGWLATAVMAAIVAGMVGTSF